MNASTSRIEVNFPGGKRVDAVLGDRIVRTDQSVAHGGEGSAAEPLELFLVSLATCAGLYVLVFCQARGIRTDELSLVQEQIFEDGKLRSIRLNVVVPADFPEKYLDAVRTAANSCKVKKLLAEPPEIDVVVSQAAGAAILAPCERQLARFGRS